MEYRQKLVEQWKSDSTVRRVAERRHMPQSVHSAVKLKREMLEARKVKEDRRRKHTKAGREKPKPERKSEFDTEQAWSGNRQFSGRQSASRPAATLHIPVFDRSDSLPKRGIVRGYQSSSHSAWEGWRTGPAVAAPRQKRANLLTTNRGSHHRAEVICFLSLDIPSAISLISRARHSPFSCCTLHAIIIKPTLP